MKTNVLFCMCMCMCFVLHVYLQLFISVILLFVLSLLQTPYVTPLMETELLFQITNLDMPECKSVVPQ